MAAGVASDPYLMTGYDRKTLALSHDSRSPVRFTLEVDITGEGLWVTQEEFVVRPGVPVRQRLPEALSAYWARLRVDQDCHATATFTYD